MLTNFVCLLFDEGVSTFILKQIRVVTKSDPMRVLKMNQNSKAIGSKTNSEPKDTKMLSSSHVIHCQYKQILIIAALKVCGSLKNDSNCSNWAL